MGLDKPGGWCLALMLLGAASAMSGSWPGADWGVPRSDERAAAREAILREKLGSALLPAMRAAGVQMWLVLDRENAPDPLHADLGGGYSGSGAAYVFWDNGSNIEKIYISSSSQPLDSPIERVFDRRLTHGRAPDALGGALREVVESRRPERIAVNTSTDAAGADGLTVSRSHFLESALGPTYAARLVPADGLVHRFRGARTAIETLWYRRLQAWTSRWQTEALTAERLVPGRTTVRTLSESLEDRALEMGLATVTDHGRYPLIVWFGDRTGMPGVIGFDRRSADDGGDPRNVPIEAGDLIALDGGLHLLNLSTDMKRSAYVLRPGERNAPDSLREAWRRMLQVAEVCARHLRPEIMGRDASRRIGTELEAAGFVVDPATPTDDRPRVVLYGHAVGNHVHDIGVRLTSRVPDSDRDWPLLEGEWISVEFHVVAAGERGRPWYVRFEQTGQVLADGFEWLAPVQKELILIDSRRGRSPRKDEQ